MNSTPAKATIGIYRHFEASGCGFRRLRPGIPIERGHAFRSKAATCSEKAAGCRCRHEELGQVFLVASRLARWAVIFRMLSPLSARR